MKKRNVRTRKKLGDSDAALEMIAKRKLARDIADDDGKRAAVHVNYVGKIGRMRVADISVGNSHFKNPAMAIALEISKALRPATSVDHGSWAGSGRAGTVIHAWPVSETKLAYRVSCFGRKTWVPKSQSEWRAPDRFWISGTHLNRKSWLRNLIVRGTRGRKYLINRNVRDAG